MTAILAVERVFELVRERFAVEAPEVSVVFGWRKPGQQINQGNGRANRIVFVPGDDEAAGAWVGARQPGKLSRSLRTFLEPCTVYVWAFDGENAANAASSLAQWRACRLLLDATVRAIDLALRQLVGIPDDQAYTKAKWLIPEGERQFGAECRFVLTLMANVPDELPDLSGPAREEITNQKPSLGYEIAPSETAVAEPDPPDWAGV